MASGYEKSEDYGGKPPSIIEILMIIALMVLISLFFLV